ncbi:MAG: protein kinase [Myxococcales bacterium]|nr:protein kinase [Myxococcales bacterium]
MADPSVTYGKYQLLERIARGGMAEVYRAKSHGVSGFEKVLVIKRILPEYARHADFIEMFINEAKIAVSLTHANIVQVFDLGYAEDSYFIAMEYVPGPDLATLLKRARRERIAVPLGTLALIGSSVARALDYAHMKRDLAGQPLHIVHRDVSPQNVLVSVDGEIKLTDFGIAKARTSVFGTEEGVVKGKFTYMSPEQARGELVDPKTDIFALGTLLYHALSGVNPWKRENTEETLAAVRAGRVEDLRRHAPDVPDGLAALIMRCLAADKAARPASAGEVHEALQPFLFDGGRRARAADAAALVAELRGAESSYTAADDVAPRLSTSFGSARRTSRPPGRPGGVRHQALSATPIERPRASRSQPPQGVGTTSSSESSRERALGVARPQPERRDVTVAVFGPVERPLPAALAQRVAWFGGRNVRSTGDLHAAIFGLDTPDGREGEAAARALLDLRRRAPALGVGPLRMGLHSGRVLVDISSALVPDEHLHALLAAGEACAAAAAPGQILATVAAQRVIHRSFDVRRLVGTEYRQVLEESAVTLTSAPFVGRAAALRVVGDEIGRAASGDRRLLGLAGEAGSGKTRLLAEAMSRLRRDHHNVSTLTVRLDQARQAVRYGALQELFRVVLGMHERDSDEETREKLGRLRELGADELGARAVAQLLGLAARAPDTGDSFDAALRRVIARVGRRLAMPRPLVVAFDGLENADRASLRVLRSILEQPERSPILAILAYRPAPGQPWRRLPNFVEHQLAPLDEGETTELLAERLGTQEVPMKLVREVLTKSAGNPLYVEEYAHALSEAGAVVVSTDGVTFRDDIAVGVPNTLRGIIRARLEHLSPTERHLVQVASVLASELDVQTLSRVVDEDEDTVEEAVGLLLRRGILQRTERGYGFVSEAMLQVVFTSLTLAARAEIHSAVAVSLEELYPQRLDELAAALAAHHEAAGSTTEAISYLERAARRSALDGAYAAAFAYLEHALDLAALASDTSHEVRLRLYGALGEVAFAGRILVAGAERMGAAFELSDVLGRLPELAHFAMLRGLLLSHANRMDDARRWLDRARAAARELGDARLLCEVTVATADTVARVGDHAAATSLLREALSFARELRDVDVQVRCLAGLATSYAAAGDGVGARDALWEAWERTPVDAPAHRRCSLHLADMHVQALVGDLRDAIDAGRRAESIAKEHGFEDEEVEALLLIGECYLMLDENGRAFSALRVAYERAHECGLTRREHQTLRLLGFLDASRHASREGWARIEKARAYAEAEGYAADMLECDYLRGYLYARDGERLRAIGTFQQTQALAVSLGNHHYARFSERAIDALRMGEPVRLAR